MSRVSKIFVALALIAGGVQPALARCEVLRLNAFEWYDTHSSYSEYRFTVWLGQYCQARSLEVTYGRPVHGLAGKCVKISGGQGGTLKISDTIYASQIYNELQQVNFRLYYHSDHCTGGPGEPGYKAYYNRPGFETFGPSEEF